MLTADIYKYTKLRIVFVHAQKAGSTMRRSLCGVTAWLLRFSLWGQRDTTVLRLLWGRWLLCRVWQRAKYLSATLPARYSPCGM